MIELPILGLITLESGILAIVFLCAGIGIGKFIKSAVIAVSVALVVLIALIVLQILPGDTFVQIPLLIPRMLYIITFIIGLIVGIAKRK